MSQENSCNWARQKDLHKSMSDIDSFDEKLSSGIYEYVEIPMKGWFLKKISHSFFMPEKLFSSNQNMINRVFKSFLIKRNMGVLFNGIKGSGKTMTAKMVANKIISELSLPVLVVRKFIPNLSEVLYAIKQDCIVFFDEFEKTHELKEEQPAILTVLDGINNSKHKRLFMFTTNKTSINENLLDRPGRILYNFDFKRVSEDLVDFLIDDILSEENKKFIPEIRDYFSTRDILSIDVVKSVLEEVENFSEPPKEFEDFLNAGIVEPPSYTLSYINEDGKEVLLTKNFKPANHSVSHMISGTKKGLCHFHNNFQRKGKSLTIVSEEQSGLFIELKAKLEDKNEWVGTLQIPLSLFIENNDGFKKILLSVFGSSFLESETSGGLNSIFVGIDKKIDDDVFANNLKKMKESSKSLFPPNVNLFQFLYGRFQTVYGTNKRDLFKIKIKPNLLGGF